MNAVNTLFVISAIIVPLMLLSLNYSAISDFYEFSVPLNSLVVGPNFFGDMKEFKKIFQDQESICFITLNKNFYCYGKPRMHGDYPLSTVIGPNGIDGELHFNPIDQGVGYFTMKNMTRISGDTALVTFADKNYRVGNKDRTDYEITDKFEFSSVIKKYDSFIAKCNNYEGTSVTIVQYLGVKRIGSVDYFLTWHMLADSETGIKCKYPEIIKHSLNHNFGEL
ncbi:hypothetical protein [Nitrosopumilus ureiphilus]|uniref:Uncharacterized protein n=1 Tax=Nitrosopumilus ureiphilus TaxID=1470067 RepID=A0A7D5RE26_9ARCH|nr:hypothetical protein [Nitrosopumilus ureiphilus]QLH07141.1 hypothetical protein C5F50_08685 [Nitrosopumilus ureiphilus]